MKQISKTIEELNRPRTSNDLWDEVHDEVNPTNAILHLQSNSEYVLRFLGPFINTSRVFIGPLQPIIKSIDIQAIINNDKNAINDAKAKMTKEINSQMPLRVNSFNRNFANINTGRQDPSGQVESIFKSMTWQKCVMVNALVKSGRDNNGSVKIFALFKTISNSIFSAIQDPNTIINGLYAHDIHISKTGKRMESSYKVTYSPSATHLEEDQINAIMNQGLFDIPTVLKGINEKKNSVYYYRVNDDYIMPDKFSECVFQGCKNIEEDKQINEIEDDISDVPITAFERRNNRNGAINSLEI